MTEDVHLQEKLDLLIKKNSWHNRLLFGATFICFSVGIYFLISRQKELLVNKVILENKYALLQKDRDNMFASYERARDSMVFLAARLQEESNIAKLEKTTLSVEKNVFNDRPETNPIAKVLPSKNIDIASSFNASNIMVTPVNERASGKEKITASAKTADKMVIAFDIENHIMQSGITEIYVCISGPDGRIVTVKAFGSGVFTTRERGERQYTAKIPVEYEAGKKKQVQLTWKQSASFAHGAYKIEIYQNGSKIGEATCLIKKGGLFGFVPKNSSLRGHITSGSVHVYIARVNAILFTECARKLSVNSRFIGGNLFF